MVDHPDITLVHQALDGSKAAQKQLHQRLDPLIRARVRVFLNGRTGTIGLHGIEDVENQIWIRLLDNEGRRLQRFDPELGRTLESFVSMIAQQEMIDLSRQRSLDSVPLEVAVEPTSKEPSPESRVASKELVVALRTHLDQVLPDRGRLVLRYLYDDGREVSEVAEIMSVNRQVVFNWKHKIKKLAQAFREENDG